MKNNIKVITEALGMTSTQFASRLGISPPAVYKTEKNEILGSVTLKTMQSFAQQLDCEFIYFLAPKHGSISQTVEKQAFKYAKMIVEHVSHTMSLEEQNIRDEEKKQQIKELQQELLSTNNKKIWDKK